MCESKVSAPCTLASKFEMYREKERFKPLTVIFLVDLTLLHLWRALQRSPLLARWLMCMRRADVAWGNLEELWSWVCCPKLFQSPFFVLCGQHLPTFLAPFLAENPPLFLTQGSTSSDLRPTSWSGNLQGLPLCYPKFRFFIHCIAILQLGHRLSAPRVLPYM